MLFTDCWTLLTGPQSSGKTSLIFQDALTTCLEQHGHVLFLTTEEKAKRKRPLENPSICSFSNLRGERAALLNNLHLRYFDPQQGSGPIFSYLSQLHRLPRQPHLIVVDDLSLLCPTFEEKSRVGSLLESVRAHATVVHQWLSSSSSISSSSSYRDGLGCVIASAPSNMKLIIKY